MSKVKKEVEKVIETLNKSDLRAKGIKLKKSKEKYIILFTVNKVLEGIKIISPDTTHFQVGDDIYPIDIEKFIYKDKFRTYFMFDVLEGQRHIDYGDSFKFNQKLLKKIIKEQIIAQSFNRFTGQQVKMSIYLAVFVGLFGGLIGYIIALVSTGVI